MKKERFPIRGSQTLDCPQGTIVTRAGAMRIALRDMPRDLKSAGFKATVNRGMYGNYWVIAYGKAVNPRAY